MDCTRSNACLRRNVVSKPVFVYATYIATTPDKLWEALTSAEFTRAYWSGYTLTSDWRIGSPVAIAGPDGVVSDSGEVLAFDPPRHLAYTFHHEQGPEAQERPSRVAYDLEPLDGQVKLTITHDDFDEGSRLFGGISAGWPQIISSLKTLLETGHALDGSTAPH
jgi:uncharacterized protein YndB with AHSA1/START domain